MRSWTYEEITDSAEKSIVRLMKAAAKNHGQQAARERSCAFGIFLGWISLTTGSQNDSDIDRLEKLTQVENS